MLLALTFTAGMVDAASFLGLGQVFTATLNGNVLLLGFGIAGGFGLPILAPLVSLAAFLAGAGAGGALLQRGGDHTRRVTIELAVEFAAFALAGGLAIAFSLDGGGVTDAIVIAVLAFAMGMRTVLVLRIAVTDMVTTLVAIPLTVLAADLLGTGHPSANPLRKVAVVVALLAGAIAGAVLLKSSLGLVLLVCAGLTAATAPTYLPWASRNVRSS